MRGHAGECAGLAGAAGGVEQGDGRLHKQATHPTVPTTYFEGPANVVHVKLTPAH